MSTIKSANKYLRPNTPPEDVLGIVNIDDPLLDQFCSYAMSQNSIVHKRGLSNLNSLMQRVTEDYFANNQIRILKYRFICEVLRNRLRGINDRNLLMYEVNKSLDISVLTQDSMFLRELNTEEINYVEFTVGEIQNHLYLNQHMKDLQTLWNDYAAADFRAKRLMLNPIREAASGLLTQFRKNDASEDSTDTLFRLSDLESGVTDIHKQITSPTFKLITGMIGMNFMLGGGFEPGNVYAFFGLPGEGKTVTLENLLYQLWKYNRGYECRDKTKKPCIVLLTMENFVRQTVCALYHILTHGQNMRDCKTADEAIRIFKENKFLFNPDDSNSIEIVIKYKPINSITTDYMYKIVDDLADEGYEVIAFLQDYVKRILPVVQYGDPYQDLGNIINDFKTFATLKRIPVITASQLNRDAAKIIDKGRNANKNDLLKELSRSNIGESVRMDENLDGTFIITPEVSRDKVKYMGFKLTKHRYEIFNDQFASIYQPFYEGSIAMVEDLGQTKPAFKESLIRDNEELSDGQRFGINKTVKIISNSNDMINSMVIPQQKPIKEPPAQKGYTFNKPAIVEMPDKPKKEVLEIIEPHEIEAMREQLGVKKVL